MSERIKVAFVISSMRRGGKETIAAEIFNGLDRAHFAPFLCVMKEGGLLKKIPDEREYANLAWFPGDVLGFAWRLWQIFRAERPQAILCFSYRIVGWVSRLLGKLMGVPVMVYEHHGVEKPQQYDFDWIDRQFMIDLTDQFIALGQPLGDKLIQDGIPAEKITVIPNGVDTDKFFPTENKALIKKKMLGFEDNPPVVGCVSNIRPVKNLPMLIKAFVRVLEAVPNAQLVIVGDGAERDALESLIDQTGIQESVHLLGMREDIPHLLQAFDLSTLTSVIEASPMAVLEAAATGLPIVATRVGDVPNMVLDGETGFLVAVDDDQTFAAKMIQLLQNPDLRFKMGQAARHHINAHFSLQGAVHAREDLLQRLLEQKR